MIALLRGRIVAASPGEAVVEVGGVGYRVQIPSGCCLGAIGAEAVLHTHLAVRDDALDLYGFPQADERDLFETLLGVTGVGPRLALAALGSLGADGFRRAVLAEDVTALTVIPGVGRKGALRMILELRERLGAAAAAADPAIGGGGNGAAIGTREQVRQALAALGYAPGEVQRSLRGLPDDPDAGVEALLRAALRDLAKR